MRIKSPDSLIFVANMQTAVSTSVSEAAAVLRRGGLLAIPTETVYGLAGNALDPFVLGRIFEAKNRPHFDPLILHLADAGQLNSVAQNIPEAAKALADAFWPGPLTLVLPRQPHVHDLATSGLDTVGVRVPEHPLTLELLSLLDFPLAAPSANPFGYISPTTAQHVLDQLGGKIDLVLDGGPCRIGLESTIIGFEEKAAQIYRLGGLAQEAIESVIGPVQLALNRSGDPRAPGQLQSHYAPKVPLLLGEPAELAKTHAGKKLGLLAFQHASPGNWATVRTLSPSGNLAEAAARLFSLLRELDTSDLDWIVAERAPDQGLGRAINDRLQRAAYAESGSSTYL